MPQGWWVASHRREGDREVHGKDCLSHVDAHQLHRVVGGHAHESSDDGLWEVVQYGSVEYRDDRHALAVLLRAVPTDMQAGLANKESVCDA
jgi:hypothetical protein